MGVAAANKVLDIFESENILENVNKQSALFLEKLNELQKKYSSLIHSIKGRGANVRYSIGRTRWARVRIFSTNYLRKRICLADQHIIIPLY